MRSTCCGWCSAHTAALRKKSLWRARILQGCRTKRRGRNQRSAAVPAAAATPELERRKFVAPSRVRSRCGRDARAPESPRAARILPSHERPARPAANSPVPIPLPQIPLPHLAVLPSGSVQRRQPNHAGPSAQGAGTPAQVVGNPPCAILSSLTATGDRSRSLGCGSAALCYNPAESSRGRRISSGARASRPQRLRTRKGATKFQRSGSDAAAAAGTAAPLGLPPRRPVFIVLLRTSTSARLHRYACGGACSRR